MNSSLLDLPSSCVIVTGMPGAGKSTVAGLLAARLPKAALLSGDVVSGMIRAGGVWALGEPADEALRQVELTHRNIALLAQSFRAAGFTAVIEAVIPNSAQLDALVAMIDPAPLLVVLTPGIESCQERNANRAENERWEFAGYDGLDAEMLAGFGDRGWWFDTANMTPEQTVERIIAEASERARLSSAG